MNDSLSPPFLQPGDGIALVSVSRFGEPAVIAQAEAWIRSHGWIPFRAPNLGSRSHQFGGDDATRAADVNWAIEHPEVKAIWSIRGGYGAVRMVDGINWLGLRAQPKWLIGFSDFTMLLGHAYRQGLCAVHSWMPIQIPTSTPKSLDSLAHLLSGHPQPLVAANHPLQRYGHAQGPVVGGNLSVLYSMLGSASFPDLHGSILALEDLDEYRYHLDRMFWGLKRAGVLEGLAGVALGSFSDMKDNAIPFGKEALEIALEALPEGIPVGMGLPFGHESHNEAFITGYRYRLVVDSAGGHLSPL
jgi:muramoyltetrapeptide carboxypeptidase